MRITRDARGASSAAAWLALALCSSACGAPRTTIEGRDEHAAFPSLRGSFELGRRDSGRPAEGSVAERTRTTSVEVELSRAEGDFDQTIAAGEIVELDDALFVGPTTIAFDVELARAAALIRLGLREDRLELGLALGLSYLDLDLEGRSGAVSGDAEERTVALATGVDLAWLALDRLRLYARAGADGSPDDVTLGQLEIGAEQGFGRAVALGVGWRLWDLEIDQISASDVDVELSGPVFLLRISR